MDPSGDLTESEIEKSNLTQIKVTSENIFQLSNILLDFPGLNGTWDNFTAPQLVEAKHLPEIKEMTFENKVKETIDYYIKKHGKNANFGEIYSIFKGLKEKSVTDKLYEEFYSKKISKGSGTTEKVYNGHFDPNVPGPNQNFVDRPIIINQIIQKLKYENNITSIGILHGMGGMGKTSIAIDIAYKHRNLGPVFWIGASSKALILHNFFQIHKNLKLKSKFKKVNQTMANSVIQEYFEKESNWLLIFDNVEEEDDVRGFYPRFGGSILITTRNRKWTNENLLIEIPPFEPEDSILFIEKFCPKVEYDSDLFSALGKELDHLPLALFHACRYINTNLIQVFKYLQLFRQCPDEYEKQNHGEVPSLFKSLKISLDKIRTESKWAYQFLCVCSYFSPWGINIEFIPKFIQVIFPDEKAMPEDQMKMELKIKSYILNYGIVKLQHENLQMHRRVSSIMRNQNRNVPSSGMIGQISKHVFKSSVTWKCEKYQIHAKQILDLMEKDPAFDQFTSLNLPNDQYLFLHLISNSNYFINKDYVLSGLKFSEMIQNFLKRFFNEVEFEPMTEVMRELPNFLENLKKFEKQNSMNGVAFLIRGYLEVGNLEKCIESMDFLIQNMEVDERFRYLNFFQDLKTDWNYSEIPILEKLHEITNRLGGNIVQNNGEYYQIISSLYDKNGEIEKAINIMEKSLGICESNLRSKEPSLVNLKDFHNRIEWILGFFKRQSDLASCKMTLYHFIGVLRWILNDEKMMERLKRKDFIFLYIYNENIMNICENMIFPQISKDYIFVMGDILEEIGCFEKYYSMNILDKYISSIKLGIRICKNLKDVQTERELIEFLLVKMRISIRNKNGDEMKNKEFCKYSKLLVNQ